MVALAGVWLAAAAIAGAQAPGFLGRLAPMPADAFEARTLRGGGMVTASLQGTTLAVEATFDGLASPVTKAELRLAQPGLRGPVQFTLTAPQTDSGKLAGSVTLTAVQVEQVRRGWFYLQLGTEVNPDGHLRGWLLPGGRL